MHLIFKNSTATKVSVTLMDGETPVARETGALDDPKKRGIVAKALKIPVEELFRAYVAWEAEDRPIEIQVEEDAPVEVYVRSISQSGRAGPMTFDAAVSQSPALDDLVMTWEGTEKLAALDVDWHREGSLDAVRLSSYMLRVRPQPEYWWITRGHGLRLVYHRDSLNADELAALAALSLSRLEPRFTYEIKRDTRYAPGEVFRTGQILDPSALSILSTKIDPSEEEVVDWLSAKGMTLGGRYPHSFCVIEPNDSAERDPVVVGDRGIYCHRCAGKVDRGFRSYSSLLGGSRAGLLQTCVCCFTHWSHAKYVVEHVTGLPESICRLLYRAALKLTHGDDPRIEKVFTSGVGLVRMERGWYWRGEPLYKNVAKLLAELPAFKTREEEKIGFNVALGVKGEHPVDLAPCGYVDLLPIWGCKIAYQHVDPPEPAIVIPSRTLASEYLEYLRPKYKPGNVEHAWKKLSECVPGVSRPLIELLIAAKGCSESQQGMPPFIFISGPSGAGKTSSTRIAGAIVDSAVTEAEWTPVRERLRQAIFMAKSRGSYCVLNEACKTGKAAGNTPVETLDFLLNLTPDSVGHQLYTGPVRLGTVPVTVWTDTVLPQEIREDTQLARRIVEAPLDRQVDWLDSLAACGANDPINLRKASEEIADACDVILSDVIDRFFSSPMNFRDIASQLGFVSLLESERAQVEGRLRAFYDAWVGEKPTDDKRFGVDTRVFQASHATPLALAWQELGEDEESRSRVCTSFDWQRIVGRPVKFVFRTKGQRIAVRFE